jgi:hypothetical protein
VINPDLVKEGDVLFDVHRTKMGNTAMSRMGWWTVRVLRIEAYDSAGRQRRRFIVSWNGNREQTYYEHQIRRLRRSKPKERRRGEP